MPPRRRTAETNASPPLPAGGIDIPLRSPAVPLDEVDRQILVLLSEDSRRSQRELARELGMSAPAVRDRTGRREGRGVIRGYGIHVDWNATGYPMAVYVAIAAAQGYQQS